MRKIIPTALGIVFPISLALTGCGGDTTTSATTPPVTVAAAPTPQPPPPPPTVSGIVDFTTIDVSRLDNYANPVLPAYYDATVAALDNTPNNNPVSDRVATLGRVLFYDKRLSVNDTTACAACHQQANGFDDPRRFSTGFSGTAFTSAHAMRLGNIKYYRPGTMFWDKRAASLELQVTQPIAHPIEMGFDSAHGGISALLTKMGPSQFARLGGDSSRGEVLQKALQQAVKDAKDAREASAKQSREDQDRRKVEVLGAKTSKVPVALKGKENDMQPA